MTKTSVTAGSKSRKTGKANSRSQSKASATAQLNPSQISVEYLLFFRAVADNLSFTKAARELEIDQSWLSHKIRQFEEMLGITLLIRNTRHVELTSAGRALLEPVHRLATVVEETRAVTEALRKSMKGVLRVGCLPFSFPDPQRTRLMDDFMTQNPSIRLNVETGPTPSLLNQLRLGEIDLAFVSAPFEEKDLDLLLLRENEFCFLLPKDHVLAAKSVIELKDVEGLKVIVPAPQYHPAAFDLYYKPLSDAGATVESTPEFQNAAAYAEDRMMPVVCTRYAAERYNSEKFVQRPVGFLPPCRKYLAKLSGRQSPSQLLMWDLANNSSELKQAA
ncbi:LysR substrate-binding domain-containing protein [Hyphomonas johnsonii]|uniref:Transcriptional regulator, LysR family protein n=1 Tax=Hyphomonas johnsonii MHS-2 TaxID=1280950 RepID=A0A059FUX5_9PROT|nr:LysR substrate-binding domain-containing protein [Hyphomonas johnsonii]KCZ94253.1 transcriptional regulator, LysR family protein [Hyphomonas johnsonii MHS-2]